MEQVSLQVEKMSCGNCLSTIEQALSSVDGVKKATGSLEDKTVHIKFDERKTKKEDLINTIERVGYIVI